MRKQLNKVRNQGEQGSCAAFSAACAAANGVFFLEPLNPTIPALAQEIVFPYLSVKVTTVLLKVDLINICFGSGHSSTKMMKITAL